MSLAWPTLRERRVEWRLFQVGVWCLSLPLLVELWKQESLSYREGICTHCATQSSPLESQASWQRLWAPKPTDWLMPGAAFPFSQAPIVPFTECGLHSRAGLRSWGLGSGCPPPSFPDSQALYFLICQSEAPGKPKGTSLRSLNWPASTPKNTPAWA